ncbi:MAG TPA: thioesterase family protein [Steroidobacteraceae bacterium]|nr:thioesterase family protein [Steroidobacteraceae bacterium]
MSDSTDYRVLIQPDWIDYNGHLRDAFYVVALSYAIDEMMVRWGLDEAYRLKTQCTLYTLELHMHFLHEIKASDELAVRTLVLDHDRKRILAACDFLCPRLPELAASAELMLLHVRQGEKPASAPFPPQIEAALNAARLTPDALAARPVVSRKIELRRR